MPLQHRGEKSWLLALLDTFKFVNRRHFNLCCDLFLNFSLCPVFEPYDTLYLQDDFFTYSLYLPFLFVAAVILRHFKFNFLFELFRHFLLHHAVLMQSNETSTVINANHALEFPVLTGEAAHGAEFRIEYIFAMATSLDSVVDDQFEHDFNGDTEKVCSLVITVEIGNVAEKR